MAPSTVFPSFSLPLSPLAVSARGNSRELVELVCYANAAGACANAPRLSRLQFQKDGVRLRQQTTKRTSVELPYQNRVASRKQDVLPNDTQHLLFTLMYFLVLSFVIIVLERNLPDPITAGTEGQYPGRFVAERARNHVVNLTSFGPRIAGSYENEVLAVNFLTTTINNVMKTAHENHKILLNVTKHSGAFPLKFLDGMTNVYRNVQNVIVKVGPHRPTMHSLLLNCHFDSFLESPGKKRVLLCTIRNASHLHNYLYEMFQVALMTVLVVL